MKRREAQSRLFFFFNHILAVGKLVLGKNRVFAGCGGGVRTLARLGDIPAQYTHPTEKQCNYSYTHPTTKQCNYSYTHPTTKQCNYSYTYTHPSTKQCNYSYTHPSSKQCSWAPTGSWTTIASRTINASGTTSNGGYRLCNSDIDVSTYPLVAARHVGTVTIAAASGQAQPVYGPAALALLDHDANAFSNIVVMTIFTTVNIDVVTFIPNTPYVVDSQGYYGNVFEYSMSNTTMSSKHSPIGGLQGWSGASQWEATFTCNLTQTFYGYRF